MTIKSRRYDKQGRKNYDQIDWSKPKPPKPAPGIIDEYDGELCTCKDDCPSPCMGKCGCMAHWNAYNDFLSKT